jgi:hypothetical protein
MEKLKKIFRIMMLTVLILFALSGIGFVGALLTNRDRYQNKKVLIEMVDKKTNETETQTASHTKIPD